MTTRTLAKRPRALEAGQALPDSEAHSWPRANDGALIMAFMRMDGARAPRGVAFGAPAATPTFVTVPEPREPLLASLDSARDAIDALHACIKKA